LRLPADVTLATPGEVTIRNLGSIQPFSHTNTVTEVSWILRFTAFPDNPAEIEIECLIDGQNEWDGTHLKQIKMNCRIDVEPVHLESPTVTMIAPQFS